VGEGFGGRYSSGATDVGTGIVYTLCSLVLFVPAPPAAEEPLSVDRTLVARNPKWGVIADLVRDKPGG
jgi:hypothetical protein